MKRIWMLLVLSTIAALSGCGASGPQFRQELIRQSNDESTIVVYRFSQFVGKGYTANIVLNGEGMGRLKDGGYIHAAVPPGRHVVEIHKGFLETGGRYPTELNIEAGQTYFVRYDQSGQVFYQGTVAVPLVRDGFSVVPEEQALRELKSLKASQ